MSTLRKVVLTVAIGGALVAPVAANPGAAESVVKSAVCNVYRCCMADCTGTEECFAFEKCELGSHCEATVEDKTCGHNFCN